MPSILITGANGQLGQELAKIYGSHPNVKLRLTDQNDLDITKHLEVNAFFAETGNYDYVINCAAYTAVDKAEEDVEVAHAVNMNGAQNLARAAKAHNAQLIHLSTDYVYHNDQNTPFKEGDETTPKSVYASTKLAGDNYVQRAFPEAIIIRTSWVYSSFGHNFVKTMLRLGRERDKLSVVFDQIGTPTYAADLASAIVNIISRLEDKTVDAAQVAGIYHFSNEGVTSWYDFAVAVFAAENIKCKVQPIETKEYPTPAKRPPFSVLNKNKIKKTFGLDIRHWSVAMHDCLHLIKTGGSE